MEDERGSDGQLPLWPAMERLDRQEREVKEVRERVAARVQALIDYLVWRWKATPEGKRPRTGR